MKKIKDIPAPDRPREKLQQKGAEALSDLELMAILLGKDTKKYDVLSVADKILHVLENNKGTKQIKAAGETLGIRLLDHIIFNHKGYYSFLEQREL